MLLDYDRLDALAEERAESFSEAEPFPWVAFDDFLPAEALRRVRKEFDEATDAWNAYHHYTERKMALTDRSALGPDTRELVDELQSPRFIAFLESVTGIEGLVADPDLEGAGLHKVEPGGFLQIHTDFLAHAKHRDWSRQINLLLYLNEDWQPEWEGDLEFWDGDVTRCVTKLAPTFNRCVLFRTDERSYHGHPRPLACPEGEARRAIALYYYRVEDHDLRIAPTRYRALPDDSATKRLLVALDGLLLRAYTAMKRYAGLTDRFVGRLLRRL